MCQVDFLFPSLILWVPLGVLDYTTLYFVHLTKVGYYLPPSCVDLNCASGSRAWGVLAWVLFGLLSVSSLFFPWFSSPETPNFLGLCAVLSYLNFMCHLPSLMWLRTVAGSGPEIGPESVLACVYGWGWETLSLKCYCRKIEDGDPGRESRNWPDCPSDHVFGWYKWDLSFRAYWPTCFTDSS